MNPTAGAGTRLKVSRVVRATPDRVFAAWTEPEQLTQWASPEGSTVTLAEVDLRVGGRYRLRIQGEDIHTAFGVYREIQPPTRLVYTWDWEEPTHAMGETLVTVEFRSHPEGTEIVLTHERFPTGEAVQAHEAGWTSCLDRLERCVR